MTLRSCRYAPCRGVLPPARHDCRAGGSLDPPPSRRWRGWASPRTAPAMRALRRKPSPAPPIRRGSSSIATGACSTAWPKSPHPTARPEISSTGYRRWRQASAAKRCCSTRPAPWSQPKRRGLLDDASLALLGHARSPAPSPSTPGAALVVVPGLRGTDGAPTLAALARPWSSADGFSGLEVAVILASRPFRLCRARCARRCRQAAARSTSCTRGGMLLLTAAGEAEAAGGSEGRNRGFSAVLPLSGQITRVIVGQMLEGAAPLHADRARLLRRRGQAGGRGHLARPLGAARDRPARRRRTPIARAIAAQRRRRRPSSDG